MKKLVMMALVLGACSNSGSGGGGGSTGPVSMSTAMSQCEKQCTREVMCQDTDNTQEECVADCVDDIDGGAFRSDAVIAITNCFSELACGADDDACIMECEPTSAHNAYETACREKFTACGGQIGGSGPEGICEVTPTGEGDAGFLCVITPSVINMLENCFSMECGEVMNCVQQVAEANGIDD